MSATPRWWPVGRGSGRLHVDLDPLDDAALARAGGPARFVLLAAVVVISLVAAGILAIVNPGTEVGPVEDLPPIGPHLGVVLDVTETQALAAGPARPPLAEGAGPGTLAETFDGPLDRWRVAGRLATEAGRLTARGPGTLFAPEGVGVAAAEIELVPGTPEAGIVLRGPDEEWTWSAGPAGLRLTRTVDGEAADVWAGVAPPDGQGGGAPRLALRRTDQEIELEARGRVLLRVTSPVPDADASEIGLVVLGHPEGGAPTGVAAGATLAPTA